jgi:hypothetical protein
MTTVLLSVCGIVLCGGAAMHDPAASSIRWQHVPYRAPFVWCDVSPLLANYATDLLSSQRPALTNPTKSLLTKPRLQQSAKGSSCNKLLQVSELCDSTVQTRQDLTVERRRHAAASASRAAAVHSAHTHTKREPKKCRASFSMPRQGGRQGWISQPKHSHITK